MQRIPPKNNRGNNQMLDYNHCFKLVALECYPCDISIMIPESMEQFKPYEKYFWNDKPLICDVCKNPYDINISMYKTQQHWDNFLIELKNLPETLLIF